MIFYVEKLVWKLWLQENMRSVGTVTTKCWGFYQANESTLRKQKGGNSHASGQVPNASYKISTLFGFDPYFLLENLVKPPYILHFTCATKYSNK